MADDTIDVKLGLKTDGMAAKAKAAGKEAGDSVGKGIDDGTKQGTGSATHSLETFGTVAKGVAVASVAAFTAVAGAVGFVGTKALESYASYEQLVGGVDTLFKDASGTVQAYAANAYKTAGLSANDYMQQVTSFSASLIKSLGGDTAAAADLGNVAMTDMSDNANKMGSNITDIQNAYQGFAKQNYTMLDNLKLGYGGTQEEMQKLLDHAEELTGTHYDLGNFGDMVSAIHAVQTEMGITGTTAAEAASTIEGSVNSAKGAWENWLTGLGNENADMSALTTQLLDAVSAVVQNVAPRIQQIGQTLVAALPGALAGISEKLTPVLAEAVSSAWNAAVAILAGAGITLPQIDASQVIDTINTISSNLQSMWSSVAPTVSGAANLVSGALQIMASNMDQVLQLLIPLAAGFAFFKTSMAIVGIIDGVKNALTAFKTAQNAATVAQAALNAVVNANPFVLVGTLIAMLIAAIITLWLTNEDFRNAVLAAWAAIQAGAAEIWGAIVNFFTVAVPEAINNMLTFFAALPGNIANFLAGVVLAVATWYVSMVSYALQTGLDFLNNIVSFFSSIPGSVAGFLGSVISTVGGFVGDMASGALQAGQQFASNLLDTISKIPGQVYSIGSDIVQGIINGISDFVGGIGDALWGGISSSIDWVKGLLGIHSPSTLMYDLIGVNIGKGAALGVPAGWKEEDPFGALRKDISLGIDSLKFRVAGSSVGKTVSAGKTIVQNFATKVVRADSDLYTAAPIIYRNAQREAR